ncbi:MAG: 50S ribosomal protein L23 [Nanoarchaeota archaeon]
MAKKVKAGKVPAAVVTDNAFDPYTVIKYPLATEKNIRQIESQNKLVFVVSPKATKADVKKAIEQLYNVKVMKVNVDNSFTGVKKAHVKLSPEHLASDVSADLGLI